MQPTLLPKASDTPSFQVDVTLAIPFCPMPFFSKCRVGVFVWSESEEDSGSSSFEDDASEYSESDSDDGLENYKLAQKEANLGFRLIWYST